MRAVKSAGFIWTGSLPCGSEEVAETGSVPDALASGPGLPVPAPESLDPEPQAVSARAAVSEGTTMSFLGETFMVPPIVEMGQLPGGR
jgi:hypothetical protein